jgi:hypothetical protein
MTKYAEVQNKADRGHSDGPESETRLHIFSEILNLRHKQEDHQK